MAQAVTQVQSLAQEILHATDIAKKKKKKLYFKYKNKNEGYKMEVGNNTLKEENANMLTLLT